VSCRRKKSEQTEKKDRKVYFKVKIIWENVETIFSKEDSRNVYKSL
jgi:hypothetical protein